MSKWGLYHLIYPTVAVKGYSHYVLCSQRVMEKPKQIYQVKLLRSRICLKKNVPTFDNNLRFRREGGNSGEYARDLKYCFRKEVPY